MPQSGETNSEQVLPPPAPTDRDSPPKDGFRAIRILLLSVAAITLAIVLVVALRTHAPDPKQVPSDANPASLAEIRAITDEARKASLDGDDEKAIKLTAESARRLEAAAASSKGTDKAVMEYAAALANAQNEILKAYINAAGVYSRAGGNDLVGLTDSQQVESRLRLLNDAIAAHDAVLKYFGSIEQRIPRELAARGVGEKDAKDFAAGFSTQANIRNLLAIHQAEHQILLASRTRFEMLRASAGRWKVNENGLLVVDARFPEKDLAEFNRLGDEITALAKQQGALVEERKAGG